jgi:hypothetical protein
VNRKVTVPVGNLAPIGLTRFLPHPGCSIRLTEFPTTKNAGIGLANPPNVAEVRGAHSNETTGRTETQRDQLTAQNDALYGHPERT